jgi:hypothetical protein
VRDIPCGTLDEIMPLHQLPRIDLLKVDCEGAEYDIFRAADDAAFDRIRQIVFEYHEVRYFDRLFEELLSRQLAHGYNLYHLPPDPRPEAEEVRRAIEPGPMSGPISTMDLAPLRAAAGG